MKNGKYGKDHPERFIEGALTGGHGPSEDITNEKIGRGQSIKRAYAMDNVDLALDIPTSLKDHDGFAGGETNLKHSLSGASAVGAADIGASGHVKHVIIPNH